MYQYLSFAIKTVWMGLFSVILFSSCEGALPDETQVVVCVPVYGQSLALGEEAVLITDADSLVKASSGRICSEGLSRSFGYYEDHGWKRRLKRLLHYPRRRFETSAYALAGELASRLGRDTAVCVIVGGAGATPISRLDSHSEAYRLFLDDIRLTHEAAAKRGARLLVPAVCWMQGESDMFDYTYVDYARQLRQFAVDLDRDIRRLTGQLEPVRVICYQSCCLSVCWEFNPLSIPCYELSIPQAQWQLVAQGDPFVAGAPTYPYDFVSNHLHLDARSQMEVGRIHAAAALDVLRHRSCQRGLWPLSVLRVDTAVSPDSSMLSVRFNHAVDIDTVHVSPADHYGLSVVTPQGTDILNRVTVRGQELLLSCSRSVQGCRVRYGANGNRGKSGRRYGARGNLRCRYPVADAYRPWCYLFDLPEGYRSGATISQPE